MPVTDPVSPWRRPVLAPMYAAVVAFAIVALASLVIPAPSGDLRISVVTTSGTPLPPGTAVDVRRFDKTVVETVALSGGATTIKNPADVDRVCVDPRQHVWIVETTDDPPTLVVPVSDQRGHACTPTLTPRPRQVMFVVTADS